MGRWYEMRITARGVDEKKFADITAAVTQEWNVEDCYDGHLYGRQFIEFSGQSALGAGETEEEFAERIRDAIWEAAGPCGVEVIATCLEDLPFEQYLFEADEYEKWLEAQCPTKTA